MKTMNMEHTCPLAYKNKQVIAKWCASKYQQKSVNQPDWNINSFASQERDDTKADVSSGRFIGQRDMRIKRSVVTQRYNMDCCRITVTSSGGPTQVQLLRSKQD